MNERKRVFVESFYTPNVQKDELMKLIQESNDGLQNYIAYLTSVFLEKDILDLYRKDKELLATIVDKLLIKGASKSIIIQFMKAYDIDAQELITQNEAQLNNSK